MKNIIERVASQLEAGERLSDADALALFESAELVEVGRLADAAARKRHGDAVFFNVNRHINPTNICALSCKFCAYSRKPGEEGGYAYSIDEMVQKAGEAVAQGATEVHMVGGLHPRWKYDHYRGMIAAIKAAYPDLHLKAFTAVELDWLSRRARMSISEVLEDLRNAGLGSLPGGGAEIFAPEVRDAICDTKVSAEQWLDTHRLAHKLGLHSNATMLYGHIERYEHRVDHLRRLRELQDETHGFNAFIPLAFQPFHNDMGIDRYTFGYDDLKTLAIARLYLDNFPHVKAYWIMLGQDIAQLALQFGANDLDGTVIDEKISHMAGGRAGLGMTRSQLEAVIRKADREPVERDTLYNAIGTMPAPRTPSVSEVDLANASERVVCGPTVDTADLSLLARQGSLHLLARLSRQKMQESGRSDLASCLPAAVLDLDRLAQGGEACVATCEAIFASSQERYGMAPAAIVVDLVPAPDAAARAPADARPADEREPDLTQILATLTAIRKAQPHVSLVVRGSKRLWSLAQAGAWKIADVASKLAKTGVDLLESSPYETESDLTLGELTALHRGIHKGGVASVLKLELDAPVAGAGAPMWEGFVQRATALAALISGNEQFAGVSVEASPGSFVTSVEYMRALALARLALPKSVSIIAPLSMLPTLSPIRGVGARKDQHPAEKIAAIALHFGASDLGVIDLSKLDPVAIVQQIRAAGATPSPRALRLVNETMSSTWTAKFADLKHAPQLMNGFV